MPNLTAVRLSRLLMWQYASSCAKTCSLPFFLSWKPLSSNGSDMHWWTHSALHIFLILFFIPLLLWSAFFPQIEGSQRHAYRYVWRLSSGDIFSLLERLVHKLLTTVLLGAMACEKLARMNVIVHGESERGKQGHGHRSPVFTTAIGSNCFTRTPPPRTSREPERQLYQYKEETEKRQGTPFPIPSFQPTNLNPSPPSGSRPLFTDTPE